MWFCFVFVCVHVCISISIYICLRACACTSIRSPITPTQPHNTKQLSHRSTTAVSTTTDDATKGGKATTTTTTTSSSSSSKKRKLPAAAEAGGGEDGGESEEEEGAGVEMSAHSRLRQEVGGVWPRQRRQAAAQIRVRRPLCSRATVVTLPASPSSGTCNVSARLLRALVFILL